MGAEGARRAKVGSVSLPSRVAVLGLGVMGGSLVRALATRLPGIRVRGWSPLEAERRGVVEAGLVERAPARWEEAVTEADLVVLATPLSSVCELLEAVASTAPEHATVSDVASLKAPVRDAARASGIQERWVGAHPMAGSEGSGFSASRADLYHGARIWIVHEPEAAVRAPSVAALWTALGADAVSIDAQEHDRMMALVSHFPQLASNAIAEVLEARHITPPELGPGGRDMTRLAASSPELWRDLLAHACPDLPEALRAGSAALARIAEDLERGDLDPVTELMRRTRAWREDR